MLKKNLFYNSLLSISQFVFPLITFPYSSRILGPNGIGSVNFIDSFTQYFLLFAALGIPMHGVREISKLKNDRTNLDKTFSEIFTIHIISTTIFSLIYFVAAFFVPSLSNHLDLVFIGIVIMYSNVFSAEWVFLGLEQFRYITIRTLIVRCLSVIFLFVFLKKNSPPIVYYAISASGFLINGILNLFNLRKLVTIKFEGLELIKHTKPLLIILSSTLAVSVYLLMDNIILGFIKGETAVGIYSTALRIVRLPFAVITAISTVIVPQVSNAYAQGDFQQIKSLIHKSFSFICVVGVPIVIGMYIAASFLVDTFAGNKFHESIITLQLMAPLVIVIGIGSISSLQLLTPMGKERYLLRAVVAGMFFSLITNIVLINFFSYQGAAISNLLTECLVSAVAFYFVRKFIDIKLDLKIFLQCLFGAALFFVIAFVIRSFNMNYMVQEVLIIVVCGIFYITYLWFFVKNIYIENLKVILLEKLKFKQLEA